VSLFKKKNPPAYMDAIHFIQILL